MNISAKERESRGIRKLSNSICIYFSINIHHRIIGVGRDACRSGSPVSCYRRLSRGGCNEPTARWEENNVLALLPGKKSTDVYLNHVSHSEYLATTL